jgi:hypothetical protein
MLEGSLLSDPKFYEWARGVVLYCHVTTHLKDHKYDGLLREKGGTGFPTLAILAADGELLVRHEGARTVAGVTATAEKAKKVAELRTRAAADPKAALDLLDVEAEAGMVPPAEMIRRAKEIGAGAPELKPRVDEILFAGEVEELSQQSRKTPETMKAACEKVLGWASEKRVPARSRAFDAFWGIVAEQGRATKDMKLMQRAVDALRESGASDKERTQTIANLEAQIATLQKYALVEELRPRADAGDPEAKRRILLAMAQLRMIPHAEAVEKRGALAGLSESQQKELDEAIFQLEVFETSRAARDPKGWDAAFAKVRSWVAEKKVPASPSASLMVWMIPLTRAMGTGDAEALDFAMKNASEESRKEPTFQMLSDLARKAVDKKKAETDGKNGDAKNRDGAPASNPKKSP